MRVAMLHKATTYTMMALHSLALFRAVAKEAIALLGRLLLSTIIVVSDNIARGNDCKVAMVELDCVLARDYS